MNSISTCNNIQTFEEAVKIIGDAWTLRIIAALQDVELRFCGIERAIPDISPATLTNRLKKLEEAGIIERKLETCDKQSVSYGLSKDGRHLVPVLDAIHAFIESA